MRKFVLMVLVLAGLSLLICTIGRAANKENLVLYFPFDEGTGDTVKDMSANGNDGVIHGGAKWVNGKLKEALEFNGEDSFVEVQDDDTLNSEVGTVAVWIKPGEQPPTDWGSNGVVNKWGQNDGGYLIQAGASPSGGFLPEGGHEIVHMVGGAVPNHKSIHINVPLDAWSHIAMTWDESTMKGYLNGEEFDEVEVEFLPPVGYSLLIGNRVTGGTGFFNGIIDEVAIFNKVLSSKEIQSTMSNVLSVQPSGKTAVTWGVLKDSLVK